jgi:hypothetical protein
MQRAGGEETTETGPAWIPFALGIYLLVCSALALYLLVDVWGDRLSILRFLFPGITFDAGRLATVKPVTYMVVGAVLGGVILSFQGLHIHAAQLRNFRPSFSGSYLIGPWAAGLLGIAVYALVRGGVLVFGGTSSAPTSTASRFAYLGLGFLTGFAWNKLLAKLNSVAVQLFATERPDRGTGTPAAPQVPTTTPQDLDTLSEGDQAAAPQPEAGRPAALRTVQPEAARPDQQGR